jgi:hypothetical protein
LLSFQRINGFFQRRSTQSSHRDLDHRGEELMAMLFSRRTWLAAVALLTIPAVPAISAPKEPGGCFDVRVDYLGRTPVANVKGVQYYRWSYRVTGTGCVTRSMDHFTLGLCAQTQQGLSQISLQSSDDTDAVGGIFTSYRAKIGKDGTTRLSGVKWDFQTGNPVDAVGECDDFSFVASGAVTPISWGAKASNFIVTGTTYGPACAPVAVAPSTWGAVKALFR